MGLGIADGRVRGGRADRSRTIRVNGRRIARFSRGRQAASGQAGVYGERFDLLPFVTARDDVIRVDTAGSSGSAAPFFAWVSLSVHRDINRDSDGDGLLDSWERRGYDHDGDGIVDVPIHRLGANPMRKDIFIAYAWMEAGAAGYDPAHPRRAEARSHRPGRRALEAIVQAFADAPVANPDGSTGITVHFKNLGGVPHDTNLSPVWTEFDAIMNPLVSEAERRIYHRMLNAHQYNGSTSSGVSRGSPASDFIEIARRLAEQSWHPKAAGRHHHA